MMSEVDDARKGFDFYDPALQTLQQMVNGEKSCAGAADALLLEVVIEIPRGSFVKRTSDGRVDFVSPFPCPFNYGSADAYIGPDGDFLDAVVLGPRLRRGTRLTVQVAGAVSLIDRGVSDDKLICSDRPVGAVRRFSILLFFRFYSVCKRLLYLLRGSADSNRCVEWCDPKAAIERSRISNLSEK
jgi:inorganic pyrophosphatase